MEKYRFWFSKRFLVSILAFFGELNIFATRANLNIAILEMTGGREVIENNKTVTQTPEFNWDSTTRGFVLGIADYGILLSPLGGYLALKFGGSIIISISTLFVSILTLLTPLSLRFNFLLFTIIRILEGVSETFRYVSFLELWTHWSPLRDRSKLVAISVSGMYAAPAITYPIFGYAVQEYGWPASFYFTGGFSLLWTIIWFALVPNSPLMDKWISKKEANYIMQNLPDALQSRPKNLKSVWKNIIRSKHAYALGMTKIIFNLGVVITITCLPMYIEDLTGSSIDKIGIYSSIPTLINIFTPPLIGYLADYLNNSTELTTTKVHKILTCSAFGIGGILLLLLTLLPNNFTLIITCLTIFKSTVCVNLVVSDLNVIALAPKCPSVLASFSALFYMLGSVSGPLIITFIVTGHSRSQWNISFVIFAAISFFGAIFFLIFGSGEPQPWSYGFANKEDKKDDQLKLIVALAPKCSSCLASYTSLFQMLGSVCTPLIIGLIVTDHSLAQWNISFMIFAVVSHVGAVFFFIFGSAKPQPWSYSIEERDKNNDRFKSNKAKTTSLVSLIT